MFSRMTRFGVVLTLTLVIFSPVVTAGDLYRTAGQQTWTHLAPSDHQFMACYAVQVYSHCGGWTTRGIYHDYCRARDAVQRYQCRGYTARLIRW